MLDRPHLPLRAKPSPTFPVEAMVLGKSREEVADLLPRLFNLCRAAQSVGVRLALDLPPRAGDEAAALRQEIIRDHVLRLALILPGHLNGSPIALPLGWQEDPQVLRTAFFGPQKRLPDTPDAFEAFLRAEDGLAGLFAKLRETFEAGDASCAPLPFVDEETAANPNARVENSWVARVAGHPVVASIGHAARGPLWRVIARCYDLQAMLDGCSLPPQNPSDGVARVPATRGLYTVTARHDGARVTAFSRVTPTDHLRAPAGVLDQTLASLPVERGRLASLVLDVLDPCSPIELEEASHA